MWRTHKSRGETSWQALSRLPVAWCRTGGISSGNKLVQSPILIALLEEEQLVCSLHFHPLPLCLATEGWQADKKKQQNTSCYCHHLLDESPQCLWSLCTVVRGASSVLVAAIPCLGVRFS